MATLPAPPRLLLRWRELCAKLVLRFVRFRCAHEAGGNGSALIPCCWWWGANELGKPFARGATIPLNSLATIRSESLCFGVLASQAGHVASPLVFLREKPENEGLGFKYGLRPRLDSAPSLVQASGGGTHLPSTHFFSFLSVRSISFTSLSFVSR